VSDQKSIQGGSSRPPWIAFSIVATVAIIIVVAFFVAQKRESQERGQRRAERLANLDRGVSCPSLASAERALETRDDDELSDTINEARKEALRALDTTGVKFGKAERLALFIAADLREERSARIDERISNRLDAAIEWCDDFEAAS
jgi:hypothetical protein